MYVIHIKVHMCRFFGFSQQGGVYRYCVWTCNWFSQLMAVDWQFGHVNCDILVRILKQLFSWNLHMLLVFLSQWMVAFLFSTQRCERVMSWLFPSDNLVWFVCFCPVFLGDSWTAFEMKCFRIHPLSTVNTFWKLLGFNEHLPVTRSSPTQKNP